MRLTRKDAESETPAPPAVAAGDILPQKTMRQQWGRRIGFTLGVLALCALAFWAGRVTFTPPQALTNAPASESVYTVTRQEVGRSYTFNATVTQERQPLAPNAASGMITAIENRETYDNGDVLYRIDNHPVRILAGPMPMYRDLGAGDRGADVQALNAALAQMGYATTPDSDRYGPATTAAVKAWQRDLGIAQSGTLERDEIYFTPNLPRAITFDRELMRVGVVLAGGETLLYTPGGEAEFALQITEQQAKIIPPNAVMTVHYDQYSWPAIISSVEYDAKADMPKYILSAPGGASVCGDECGVLPAQEELLIPVEIEAVAKHSGPVVPVSAISSDSPDHTWVVVVGEDGATERKDVKVVVAAEGLAVVDGLEEGTRVQVFGQADAPNLTNQNQPAPGTPSGDGPTIREDSTPATPEESAPASESDAP